ncbi:MAG: diguanylate cyclase [Chloroflexi bacterium]|nr:MAG: diguanylate cyclase [Chloroflexota bacterium]
MELKKYFSILLHWWWVVLAGFLVVTVAGFAFSFSRKPMYQSSITLIVNPKASIADLTAVRQSLDTLENASVINTYAEIARSRKIYELAKAGESAASTSASAAAGGAQAPVEILVNVIQKTNLIRIDARGGSPQQVHSMANAVADQSIAYVNDLNELYEITVLDSAELPALPYSPNVLRDTGLAAALGSIFGIFAAFAVEYLRRPIGVFESLSILDGETGLHNKRYFLQRLREEINRSKRNKRPLSVCLINLNSLNNAEAQVPKQAQVMLRRRVYAYLRRHIRQDEILAHWDNDKIAWMLLDTSKRATEQAIERLCSLLEKRAFEEEESGGKLYYSGSFGAAVYTGFVNDTELITLSEQALRQTAQSAPGNVHVIAGIDEE